jgi:tRNA (Thr-GGU) A37 N-methylase
MKSYALQPIGFIRSTVKGREDAPRQGPEGASDAWLEIEPRFADALLGMEVRHGESVLGRIGHELIVITWLHEAKRDVLKGHPRNDPNRPLTGSPRRPLTCATEPGRAASGDGA